jgi:hypothetical protein
MNPKLLLDHADRPASNCACEISQRLAELVHFDDERNVFTLTAQMDDSPTAASL